jgi:microcystin-dependent protein
MATGVASWVKSPASANASADQNVNMAEGMAPSLVNDGVRALMSSVAMWRDDTAGILTAGTSTAYTITTNQGFASLAALDGRKLAITMHVSSGATPTLAVDLIGVAKPIRLQTGVALSAAGTLVQGSTYSVIYNNSTGEFLVRDQTGQQVPVGTVTSYAGSSAPAGWLLCLGQQVSRTGATAALFAAIGTTYGTGDGSTTFNLPDLRGRVVAGIDSNVPGSFANRITVAGGNFDGTVLGGSGGLQNHTLLVGEIPGHTHGITEPNSGTGHTHGFTIKSGYNNIPVGPGGGQGGGGSAYELLVTDPFTINSAVSGVITNQGDTARPATAPGSGAGGSGGAANFHTVLPPTIVMNYIIKT